IPVGDAVERRGVAPVLERQAHGADQIPLAVAVHAVAHGAVVAVNLFDRGEAFGSGLDGILGIRDRLRSLAGSRRVLGLFLRLVLRSLERDSGEKQDSQTDDPMAHSNLRAARMSRLTTFVLSAEDSGQNRFLPRILHPRTRAGASGIPGCGLGGTTRGRASWGRTRPPPRAAPPARARPPSPPAPGPPAPPAPPWV